MNYNIENSSGEFVIGQVLLPNTTRKKAFIDCFFTVNIGYIYIRQGKIYIHICHLCQCQEMSKTTLTFIHVKVVPNSTNDKSLLIL